MKKSLDDIEREIFEVEERIKNLEGDMSLRKFMIYNLKSRLKHLLDEREFCLKGMDKSYDEID